MPSSAAQRASEARLERGRAAQAVRKAIDTNGIDPWDGVNVGIEHAGNKIVLPASPALMDHNTAIETLIRIRDEEQQIVSINELVDAYPMDGAVAFQKAMQAQFGWTSAVPTPGFFGPQPPTTIEVDIGPKPTDKVSVIWGRFELPGVEDGFVHCGTHHTPKGPRFLIGGQVKRVHHKIIKELAILTRQIAAADSIYRCKAIKFTVNDNGLIDWDSGISFSDLSGINPDELVFSESTLVQIKTSLWTMIEQTQRCRMHQVPLKRGILMTGKYGTGKSLTAAVTALKAVETGEWTFLSISRVSGLKDAINFATKFQPCVIFAEDIDRVISGEDRTVTIDDILNTIDGVESKGVEIMVVLTTNAVETITKAMLRPGRLDAVIEITPPDAPAVKKLVRLYSRSLLDPDDPLDKCAEILSGQIPAMIRECTERAKLYAIGRSLSDDDLLITDEDVYNAAFGMKPHMELLEGKIEGRREPSLQEIVEEGMLRGISQILDVEQSIAQTVNQVDGKVNVVAGEISRMQGGRSVIIETIRQTLEASFRRYGFRDRSG